MKRFAVLIFFVALGGDWGARGLFFENKSTLDFLIPTMRSSNEKCRNHSIFYRNELEKFTVWATDMFDSSSKFPSGIFAGSIYDTGNFDECIQVRSEKLEFSGQHCMAHFKISPFVPAHLPKFTLKYDKYENIFNISTWQKIAIYAQDPTKQIRNEIYYTFCIPSSCSHKDLEEVLKNYIEENQKDLPFKLDVEVNKKNCQIDTPFNFTRGEIIYILIVGSFILLAILCTFYHHLTKLDEFQWMKLGGKIHQIFVAFSFGHTIKKMAKISTSDPGNLRCLHGIKVLSMFMVIIGHRLMFTISSPLENSVFAEYIYRLPASCVMLAGPILVDTFFCIGGFLVSYHLFKELSKPKFRFNYLLLVFHRVVRFTPVYAVVLGFYSTIFYKLGSGPFWEERIGVERERCQKSWWVNLIYSNNVINLDYICMFQSWYITCDLQFFQMAPYLIVFIFKKPRMGSLFLILLFVISVIVPATVIFQKQENPMILLFLRFLRDPVVDHTFLNIYIPTYMRASPYLIGIYTGYLKHRIEVDQFKFHKLMTYFGWISCTLIAVVTLYAGFFFYLPSDHDDHVYAAIYGSMSHVMWGVGTAWMILAVSEGQGAWIAPILNWSPLVLLSRITLPAFLCHGAFQLYSAGVTRKPITLGFYSVLSASFADIVWAYMTGFALSLVFEAPMIEIEKILLLKPQHPQKSVSEKPQDRYIVKDPKIFDIYIPKITNSLK